MNLNRNVLARTFDLASIPQSERGDWEAIFMTDRTILDRIKASNQIKDILEENMKNMEIVMKYLNDLETYTKKKEKVQKIRDKYRSWKKILEEYLEESNDHLIYTRDDILGAMAEGNDPMMKSLGKKVKGLKKKQLGPPSLGLPPKDLYLSDEDTFQSRRKARKKVRSISRSQKVRRSKRRIAEMP